MSYSSSFIFESMSRIGNDNNYIDQNSIQNSQACNYLLQNFYANDCSMQNTTNLATSQPAIFYKGGYGSAAGGCNIEENSKLLIGSIQTNTKCRTDLFQRPFATVPFLGRGSADPILESQMKQGETSTNKRTVTKLMESSHLEYTTIPLLSSMQDIIINHSKVIDSQREGGITTRDLNRDKI